MAWLVDPGVTRSDNDMVRARTAVHDDVRTQYAKTELFTTLRCVEPCLVRLPADYSAHCATDQPSVEVQVFVR